jgi:hypothetical protein
MRLIWKYSEAKSNANPHGQTNEPEGHHYHVRSFNQDLIAESIRVFYAPYGHVHQIKLKNIFNKMLRIKIIKKN